MFLGEIGLKGQLHVIQQLHLYRRERERERNERDRPAAAVYIDHNKIRRAQTKQTEMSCNMITRITLGHFIMIFPYTVSLLC